MKLLLPLMFAMCLALAGCANPDTNLVTVGAQLTTIEIIGHQPPAKQTGIAQITLNVATAVATATQDNPDLTTIKSYTRPAIAKELAKLAPADALVVQLIADAALDAADLAYVNTLTAATSTDKGKLAQGIAQAALSGIQAGASQFLKPPATQPSK